MASIAAASVPPFLRSSANRRATTLITRGASPHQPTAPVGHVSRATRRVAARIAAAIRPPPRSHHGPSADHSRRRPAFSRSNTTYYKCLCLRTPAAATSTTFDGRPGRMSSTQPHSDRSPPFAGIPSSTSSPSFTARSLPSTQAAMDRGGGRGEMLLGRERPRAVSAAPAGVAPCRCLLVRHSTRGYWRSAIFFHLSATG